MKKLLLTLLMVLTLAVPLATAAVTEVPLIPAPDFLPTPPPETTGGLLQDYVLDTAVPKAINIGIGILALTAFMGILIAAIQMLTAYGDETKIGRGKTNLRYSILGLIIVMLSYALVSIVVSVALPQESETSWIPSAYAVDVERDPSILLPDVETLIESHDEQGRVSLPSGDFLGEIVPAVVTNILYFVGFLLFIALLYGGVLIVIGRGNEEEITKAKTIVLYASIALGLVSLGYAIVYGIVTLNFNQDSSTTTDDAFTEMQNE
ncbi:hypothetical protein IPG41_02440 [Candidatus Peregrinibacteria bacterium]|nr:MAG: hypothetical protein IPG41_02440 [Candidatus Peregrinibacteria bacterium]